MATLPMTKLMVLASLIFSAYTPVALAAQDARACQNKCAEKMQQCLAKSSPRMSTRPAMGMSNSPPTRPAMGMSNNPLTTPSTKCADGKQACERACK